MKFVINQFLPTTELIVSVPLRGYGFEMVDAQAWKNGETKGFPSPYGDMVLKFYGGDGDATFVAVSVPLRGYGFEMMSRQPFLFFRTVSVPLRGYGPEITRDGVKRRSGAPLFPSPYGDIVLKLYDLDGETKLCSVEVSVPLRGYCFEILAVGCLAVPSSICRFAARMYFPSFLRRRCVLKVAVCLTALSAAGISLSV